MFSLPLSSTGVAHNVAAPYYFEKLEKIKQLRRKLRVLIGRWRLFAEAQHLSKLALEQAIGSNFENSGTAVSPLPGGQVLLVAVCIGEPDIPIPPGEARDHMRSGKLKPRADIRLSWSYTNDGKLEVYGAS